MSRLTRDGTAEPGSRNQIIRRESGQGNVHFPWSANHEQDGQLYPVDPYSCFVCDHTPRRRVQYTGRFRVKRSCLTTDFFIVIWPTCCVTVVSSVARTICWMLCESTTSTTTGPNNVLLLCSTYSSYFSYCCRYCHNVRLKWRMVPAMTMMRQEPGGVFFRSPTIFAQSFFLLDRKTCYLFGVFLLNNKRISRTLLVQYWVWRKIWTHLDLLSTPQSGAKCQNV